MAVEEDLDLDRGLTFSTQYTWKDKTRTLVNLTGYAMRLSIKESLKDTVPVLTISSDTGEIVLGGALGTIDITLTPEQTALLVKDAYYFDLIYLTAGGRGDKLLFGTINVHSVITDL